MPGKIAFFLGGGARHIRGGFKVLFTYANFLAQQGFAVTAVFPATNSNNREDAPVARKLRYLAGKVSSGVYLPRPWFELHPAIETRWVWSSTPQMLREFDLCVIADRTVGADVLERPSVGIARRPKLLYLFQEYEYYMSGSATTCRQIESVLRGVDAAVAISPAAHDVAERIRGARGNVYLVPNGIELDRYFVTGRSRYGERRGIGFAFREEPFKRSGDVVAALTQLRKLGVLEGLECWAYGARKRPGLPSWIRYHYLPTSSELRDLLNETAAFIVSSAFEGWGLPGAEAMACGAALITSRNGGCEAYAIHGENALLYTPGNVQELIETLQSLLQQPQRAEALAARGRQSIQAFTWEAACSGFLRCIQQVAG